MVVSEVKWFNSLQDTQQLLSPGDSTGEDVKRQFGKNLKIGSFAVF